MYCLQRGFGHRGDGFVFFSDGTLQHTELVTHTTRSGESRGTQREQTGQNLGHADSQVVEQFLPVRQYSRSLHDFHGTFYTGFHLSTSGKCVTGRKTLDFAMSESALRVSCRPSLLSVKMRVYCSSCFVVVCSFQSLSGNDIHHMTEGDFRLSCCARRFSFRIFSWEKS